MQSTVLRYLRFALANRCQNIRYDLHFRLRALRATVVQAHADLSRFHVATADDEHRVDGQLFRVGDLRLERRRAKSGSTPTMFARSSFTMGLAELINASSSLSVITRT